VLCSVLLIRVPSRIIAVLTAVKCALQATLTPAAFHATSLAHNTVALVQQCAAQTACLTLVQHHTLEQQQHKALTALQSEGAA
jgi:hypothetical protein